MQENRKQMRFMNMNRRICFVVFLFAVLALIMPVPAYADAGPKPSVVVTFEGLDGERFYATLLSERDSTGPHSVLGKYQNNQKYHEGDKDYEIWQKFLSYQDEDGFYFLQYFQNCTDTLKFTWGYYPPHRFKILLYFPEQDSFIVSDEIHERYAFDSYYKVDARNLEVNPEKVSGSIIVEKNYDFTWEIISLFARIILTIAVEILIAVLFGFTARKQLYIVAAVNILTQSVLNIMLNIVNYKQGSLMFVFNYIWMELLIFFIEAVAFSVLLYKYRGERKIAKWLAPVYAFVANAMSFVLGFFIAYLIPGIF